MVLVNDRNRVDFGGEVKRELGGVVRRLVHANHAVVIDPARKTTRKEGQK